MSCFQVGGSGFEGAGRGESGFDRALSSQLAFVGLHRRGSSVLEGLLLSVGSEVGGVVGRYSGIEGLAFPDATSAVLEI